MPSTYEPIASTTLSSPATTITISSIPATYTDLRLVFFGQEVELTQISKRLRFNSDSATNYSTSHIFSNGTTVGTNSQSSETGMRFSSNQYGDGATYFIYTTFDIFSYAGSTNKTVLIQNSADGDLSNTGYGSVQRTVGLWRNTSAITSISLIFLNSSTWATGSTITLYGIKAA